MTSLTLLSGQAFTLTRTALNALSTIKSDEADIATSFTFTFQGASSHTLAFTMGSWTSGVTTFTLTAPTVSDIESGTLIRTYSPNGSIAFSPNTVSMTVLPGYKGNFVLNGASLAWDGTVQWVPYVGSTSTQMFDYSLNGSMGTASDGVSNIHGLTPATNYTTSNGGAQISLNRACAGYVGDVGGPMIQLTSNNDPTGILVKDFTKDWAITTQGVFWREFAQDLNANLNLFSVAVDGAGFQNPAATPTNSVACVTYRPGMNLDFYIVNATDTGYNASYGVTTPLNDAAHRWDSALQIIHVAMVTQYSVSTNSITNTGYVNGVLVGSKIIPLTGNTLTSYFELAESRSVKVLVPQAMGGTGIGFAVFDFMLSNSAQTQAQIQQNAAAWGLA